MLIQLAELQQTIVIIYIYMKNSHLFQEDLTTHWGLTYYEICRKTSDPKYDEVKDQPDQSCN